MTGREAEISAKFVYGPFDVAALTGEKVTLEIRTEASDTGWRQLAQKDTDNNGKVQFTISEGRRQLCLQP